MVASRLGQPITSFNKVRRNYKEKTTDRFGELKVQMYVFLFGFYLVISKYKWDSDQEEIILEGSCGIA